MLDLCALRQLHCELTPSLHGWLGVLASDAGFFVRGLSLRVVMLSRLGTRVKMASENELALKAVQLLSGKGL